MSQTTRTQNSGEEGNPRRNNPPQYNLRPLLPQVEEQEGNEPPPVARRRLERHQPCRETKMEHLEQHIDTLTQLVNTLVAALDQNAANMTPVIPPGIPPANAEGKEAPPPQEGEGATASEARTNNDAHRRHVQHRRRSTRQERPKN